jgi:hypothetical protein
MATKIKCDINAGMERVFKFLDGGKPCSISRNAKFDVLFEVKDPNTPKEKRFFHVIDRSTGVQKFKIPLNDRAGVKPLNGHTAHYEPNRRPNLKKGFPVDIDSQRVIFAEINLSADPTMEVYLRIDIKNKSEDKRRFLSFKRKGTVTTSQEEIPEIFLDDNGGKKPLGSSSN